MYAIAVTAVPTLVDKTKVGFPLESLKAVSAVRLGGIPARAQNKDKAPWPRDYELQAGSIELRFRPNATIRRLRPSAGRKRGCILH